MGRPNLNPAQFLFLFKGCQGELAKGGSKGTREGVRVGGGGRPPSYPLPRTNKNVKGFL